ncbi:hypothetical protein FQN54_004556 [Arachnomyces sp. PD_36]|nr:hypothetical protein FQN54_004556 [Arachnomyces sp. PD_36]
MFFRTFQQVWLLASVISSAAAAVPPPDANGKYTLNSTGISASFIPYSAAITNLYVEDKNGVVRDIVLGYDDAEDYVDDPNHPNYGAVPGRYANRISNATYVIDGKRYYTERNQNNGTLHSGTNGWSYREWNVSSVSEDSITFTLRDESNESKGMIGLVLAEVTYTLSPYAWSIKIEAESVDQNTPIMTTSHPYWNLDAFANPNNDTILGHTYSMPFSKRIIAYDEWSVPNGELPDIPEKSINDFWSKPKKLGEDSDLEEWIGNCGPDLGGYDCAWIVDRDEEDDEVGAMEDPVASLWSDWSGIQVDMYSSQPSVVMTTSGFFSPGAIPIKKTQGGPANDGTVPTYGAIAMEAQDWVDGINNPQWDRLDKQIFGPDTGKYVNEIVYRIGLK